MHAHYKIPIGTTIRRKLPNIHTKTHYIRSCKHDGHRSSDNCMSRTLMGPTIYMLIVVSLSARCILEITITIQLFHLPPFFKRFIIVFIVVIIFRMVAYGEAIKKRYINNCQKRSYNLISQN